MLEVWLGREYLLFKEIIAVTFLKIISNALDRESVKVIIISDPNIVRACRAYPSNVRNG